MRPHFGDDFLTDGVANDPASTRGDANSVGLTPVAVGRSIVWVDPVSTIRIASRRLMRARMRRELATGRQSKGEDEGALAPLPPFRWHWHR